MGLTTFDLTAFEAARGEDRASRAQALDRACRETGFVVLTGHGVSKAVIDAQWAAVGQFFAQSDAQKAQVSAPAGYPYGWIGPQQEALAASKGEETPPDLKESFNGGPLAVPPGASTDAMAFCYQPTLWPDIDGFREAWEVYYVAMEQLAVRIMAAFAAALKLDEAFFAPFIGAPISALRALHYPATGAVTQAQQQRAGAHTDYGSLTILLPQAGVGGLQVKQGDAWIDVRVPEGAFVINIGDLMALWTRGRWVSTLHRVVALPHQDARKSLAFFHQPDWDAEIAPLDVVQGGTGDDQASEDTAEDTVISGPYLMQKFQSTGV